MARNDLIFSTEGKWGLRFLRSGSKLKKQICSIGEKELGKRDFS